MMLKFLQGKYIVDISMLHPCSVQFCQENLFDFLELLVKIICSGHWCTLDLKFFLGVWCDNV